MYCQTSKKSTAAVIALLSSVIFVVFLTGCTAPKGNSLDGQRWYKMNNCSSCHGDSGNNGLAPNIAGLELGFGSFLDYLREPESPSKPTYSEAKISKQDAVDIYVWLKGITTQ